MQISALSGFIAAVSISASVESRSCKATRKDALTSTGTNSIPALSIPKPTMVDLTVETFLSLTHYSLCLTLDSNM